MPSRLILVAAVVGFILPSSAGAQLFDRQFTANESISERSDDNAVAAFRSFVGRHAFGGKIGGFFGCGAAGGGECNAIRKMSGPPGHHGGHRSESPSASEPDAGGDSCSPSI